jgi:thiamine biosynthesis lipoprotein
MRKIITVLISLTFIFSLSACKKSLPTDCDYVKGTNTVTCTKQYLTYFDTLISVSIYYDDEKTEEDITVIFNNVTDILETYNSIGDKYKLYEGVVNVKTINDSPTSTHVISKELYDLIDYSLSHQEEVTQLFNIALGPVLNEWHDYRDSCDINLKDVNCTLPELSVLEAANAFTDSTKITLDKTNSTITMKDNMSIDVGGITKGYASNKLSEYLDSLSIRGYLINNGLSNISVGGIHPTRENEKFLIGITDPTNALDTYLYLYVSDGDEVITSGDYQQYGITDGEIYHHIINPLTLYPSTYMHSITLITDDAALGDIYSTALFSMSIEDGLLFVNNRDNIEAVWYGLDDEIYYSNNFESNYTQK